MSYVDDLYTGKSNVKVMLCVWLCVLSELIAQEQRVLEMSDSIAH